MHIKTSIIGIICFLVVLAGSYWLTKEINGHNVYHSPFYSLNKNIYHSVSTRYELQLIYIGSSGCHYCNVPAIPKAVNNIRDALYLQSQKHGLGFSFVGISEDLVITKGLKHLSKIGHFDEIMTGKGWV